MKLSNLTFGLSDKAQATIRHYERPSLGEDLSLKIEVHDETIWKSAQEL